MFNQLSEVEQQPQQIKTADDGESDQSS